MNKCDKCINQDKRYSTNKGNIYCSKLLKYSTRNIRDNCSDFEQIKYTNADKIREMSNEELLEFIKSINQTYSISSGNIMCVDNKWFYKDEQISKWLESEVE